MRFLPAQLFGLRGRERLAIYHPLAFNFGNLLIIHVNSSEVKSLTSTKAVEPKSLVELSFWYKIQSSSSALSTVTV